MKPPVVGSPDAVTGEGDCVGWLPRPVLVRGARAALFVIGDDSWPAVAPPPPPPPPPLVPKAERSTTASFTASAFLRCTTHNPPPGPSPVVGRSSLATVARTIAIRA